MLANFSRLQNITFGLVGTLWSLKLLLERQFTPIFSHKISWLYPLVFFIRNPFSLDRNTRLRGVAPTGKVDSTERRSLSLPRRPARPTAPTVSKEIPTGTGRRLPRTPQQAAIPLHHQNGPGGGSGRKRELPKPQSLELRHSNREFMNTSNASMGLNGGLLGRSSRSMNFPRVEGSPTHSECSSESGFLLSRQRPRPPHSAMFRSNSVSRRKLPDLWQSRACHRSISILPDDDGAKCLTSQCAFKFVPKPLQQQQQQQQLELTTYVKSFFHDATLGGHSSQLLISFIYLHFTSTLLQSFSPMDHVITDLIRTTIILHHLLPLSHRIINLVK